MGLAKYVAGMCTYPQYGHDGIEEPSQRAIVTNIREYSSLTPVIPPIFSGRLPGGSRTGGGTRLSKPSFVPVFSRFFRRTGAKEQVARILRPIALEEMACEGPSC